MQISVLTEDTALWQAMVRGQQERTSARASGLHLSTITNDIAATLWPKDFGYLVDRKAAGQEAEYDERTKALFEAGDVLEDTLAAVMSRRAGWAKPEPRNVGGIWCSPDGQLSATRTLDEMKCTWKSARDFRNTPKFKLYTFQVLAYMFAYSAHRARLHVFHVNGDWRPPRPMPPTTYILRPTGAEIRENWELLKQHAKDRGWL